MEQPEREAPSRPVPPRSTEPVPWSTLGVVIVSLLLPAGGAILTITNLHRLHQIERMPARRQTIALLAVFAIGYSILLALTPMNSAGSQSIDGTASLILSIGVGAASYLALRRPFQTWRSRSTTRTAPWLKALGIAFLYQLLTLLLAVPVYFVLTAVGDAMSGGTMKT